METNAQQASEALHNRVRCAFQECGMPELRRLSLATEDDRLVIRGDVPTYYAKQVAQTLLLEMSDIGPFRNAINVNRGLAAH